MSNSANSILRKARKFVKSGQVDLARKEYSEILTKYPQNQAALKELRALQAKPMDEQKSAGPSSEELSAIRKMLQQGKVSLVIAASEKFQQIYPNSAQLHCLTGDAEFANRNLQKAAISYSKAVKLEPKNATIFFKLGLTFQDLNRLDIAQDCYEKAIKINASFPEAFCNLGIVLSKLGEIDKAILQFKRALEINPEFAEALFNMGDTWITIGKLKEGEALVRKALSVNPCMPEAHRSISILKTFTSHDEDVIAMEKAYERKEVDENQKGLLAFCLGKVMEDLGQYEKSFKYYDEGNFIRRKSIDYSVEQENKFFESVKNVFNAHVFANESYTGFMDESPIFIVGMPRSGTTLIEQIISTHPDVYGAGELDFLAELGLAKIPLAKLLETIEQNPDALLDAGREYIVKIRQIDKSTKYITDKMPINFQKLGLIKLILPNAKIVHCCRDARDTCFSIFKNNFTSQGNRYAHDLQELANFHNLYLDLMAYWHEVLPGFIFDIRYEDMVADQETNTRALLDFCGLEWNDACLSYYDSKRAVRTSSVAQVRKPIYKNSVKSWQNYQKNLAPLIDSLKI